MTFNSSKEAVRAPAPTSARAQSASKIVVEERETSAPSAPGKSRGEERRRSQRVLLRVRVNVYVNLKGQQTTLEVRTLSVNPFGAMIISEENLAPQTRLVLENTVTQQRVACCVVRGAKEMPDGFHIPIQFDAPAPKFWMIDFPPDDWKLPDDL
jgi:hypothetical protein